MRRRVLNCRIYLCSTDDLIRMTVCEFQYEKENIYNFQIRTIEIENWWTYVNIVLHRDSRYDTIAYPPIPRNSLITDVIELTDNRLVFIFQHWEIGTVIHVATVVER